jgi:predicted RND superfamily exporter protein
VPQREAVLLLKKMEEKAKARIQSYKDFAESLKERYKAYETEAAAHYEKIAEQMRADVKKQLKESEDVHNNLRWNIDQNKIMITFLETRVQEVSKTVADKEKELSDREKMYNEEVKRIKKEVHE